MRRIRDLGVTVTPPVQQETEPGYFCGAKKKPPANICQKGSTSGIFPTLCPAGRPTCKKKPPTKKKAESRFNSEVVLQLRQQLEAQLDG